MPEQSQPLLIGTNDRPVEVGRHGATTTLAVTPVPDVPEGLAARSLAAPRMYLNVTDIEGTRNPGVVFGVYLNLPDNRPPSPPTPPTPRLPGLHQDAARSTPAADSAAPLDRADHLAGLISFFGIEDTDPATAAATRKEPHGMRYSFDVTDVVDRLRSAGHWQDGTMRVTLLPRHARRRAGTSGRRRARAGQSGYVQPLPGLSTGPSRRSARGPGREPADRGGRGTRESLVSLLGRVGAAGPTAPRERRPSLLARRPGSAADRRVSDGLGGAGGRPTGRVGIAGDSAKRCRPTVPVHAGRRTRQPVHPRRNRSRDRHDGGHDGPVRVVRRADYGVHQPLVARRSGRGDLPGRIPAHLDGDRAVPGRGRDGVDDVVGFGSRRGPPCCWACARSPSSTRPGRRR